MPLEARWAEYARVQSTAKLAGSIVHSDANDVRLDRLVEGIALDTAEKAVGLERAVRSYARRERSRKQTRRLTGHAFAPEGTPNPEQVLIWKQSWIRFEQTFSAPDLHLLVQSNLMTRTAPMAGAERTRLSRIRSSAAYKAAHIAAFG
jgi:hypothetical protein